MIKLSKEVEEYIKNKILPELKLSKITDENIVDIEQYIWIEKEGPLCDAEEAGEKLNSEQKEELRLATKAVTEITSDPDWSK